MIRHDLRFIQANMREMGRNGLPAFVNDPASVVQIHYGIVPVPGDPPEQFLAVARTQGHVECPLRVIPTWQTGVFMVDLGHWPSRPDGSTLQRHFNLPMMSCFVRIPNPFGI